MDEEIDFSKLKYVLYARKSSTDETRQVRSIPDQIYDCELLADRIGIKVIKVLEETKSAKKPHQRPIFTQMLKDIRQGVYDGILAWNPDRLARNMLEAGMLIDMVDTGVIKDLKFVTHTYSPDANDKMLLGMSFVLSKQYSDDLSQKVTRGVRRNLAEGKTPTPKHGYINENLESGLNFNEKEYQQYSDGLDKITGVNGRKMSIQLHSMEGSLKSLKQDIRERSLGIVKFSKGSRIAKENNDEINKLAVQEESLTKDITDLRAKLATPEQDKLSMEQFLNLSDNAAATVQAGNPVVKDKICREIFLNFTIKDKIVVSYQLNQPFDRFIKEAKIPSSRRPGN